MLLYFRRDWVLFGASLRRDLRAHGGSVGRWRPRSRLALLIVLGSIPAFAAGAAITLTLEDGLREPWLVGVLLIAVGLVIWVLDRAAQSRSLRDLGAGGALLIGVAQATALVPGVSRSGATIAAGRGLGLRREAATRFSFLLSAPAVVGAAVALLGEAILGGEEVAWGPLLLGALVAAARRDGRDPLAAAVRAPPQPRGLRLVPPRGRRRRARRRRGGRAIASRATIGARATTARRR